MKFPTLPIRLWTAFAAVLVSAGCARPAFEVSWRQTLDNADGGLLRVWNIADPAIRSSCAGAPSR